MSILTIARSTGSYGDQIAQAVASRLHLDYFDHERVMQQFVLPLVDKQTYALLTYSPKHFLQETNEGLSFKDYVYGALQEHAKRDPIALVGFAGVHFFQDDAEAIHVQLYADNDVRIARTATAKHCSNLEAAKFIQKKDRQSRRFASTLFGVLDGPEHYHLSINTGKVGHIEAVDAIAALYESSAVARALNATSVAGSLANDSTYPQLKNASEIEFAKLLDHYELDWRYEPRTFPVEWDETGRVTMAFSPDFYLPRFDLYLELTTMNQKYVSLKNKKLAKLKERYPGVNVRIVYKRDFQAMMERFED